mgnify:CR=1 FL=1
MIEILVNYGIDINDIEDTIFTELMEETRQSHIEIINLLIKNGANVNATNKNGVTPLTISVKSGRAEMVKHFITQGADMNSTVRWANEHNSYEEVQKILLENGAIMI